MMLYKLAEEMPAKEITDKRQIMQVLPLTSQLQ